jgi:cell division transport system permease protein
LGGGLLALILVAVASTVLARPVAQLAFLYGSAFSLEGLKIVTALVVLGLAVGLSWIGSWLAATRHIRAIEPA